MKTSSNSIGLEVQDSSKRSGGWSHIRSLVKGPKQFPFQAVLVFFLLAIVPGLLLFSSPTEAQGSDDDSTWHMRGANGARTSSVESVATGLDSVDWKTLEATRLSDPPQLIASEDHIFVWIDQEVIGIDAEDGDILWSASRDDEGGPAAVARGHVYVWGEGEIRQYEATDGQENAGWGGEAPSRDIERDVVVNPPTVIDDQVLATTEASKLASFQRDNGEMNWEVQISPPSQGASFRGPIVDSGTVFVASPGHGDERSGGITAIDLESETVKWSIDHPNPLSGLTEGDKRIFARGPHGGIWGFGQEEGHQKLSEEIRYPCKENEGSDSTDFEPAIYGTGRLFVGPGPCGEKIVTLDAETGDELWRKEAKNEKRFLLDAALGDSRLFVSTGRGDSSIEDTTGEIDVLDVETGEITQTFEVEKPLMKIALQGQDFFGISVEGKVMNINVETGGEKGDGEEADQERSSITPQDWPMAGLNMQRSASSMTTGSGSGDKLWTFPTEHPIRSSPAVANEMVYFGTVGGKFYAIDLASGDEKWSRNLGASTHSSPVVANGMAYIGTDGGELLAFDLKDRFVRWQVALDGRVETAPIIHDGIVYAVGGGVFAFDIETGEEKWSVKEHPYVEEWAPAVSGVSPLVLDGKLWTTFESGHLACDTGTGVLVHTF
jgi:outer membrane protein assembly factor BamB